MDNLSKAKVLVIGKVWPESKSSAAGKRMLDLIGIFYDAGADIHFASTALVNEDSDSLSRFNTTNHKIQVNDNQFDVWINALEPDIIIFDRFMTEEQFGWRVEKACPMALRVIDTEDLHGLRAARKQALKRGGKLNFHDCTNDVAIREVASILRSDLNLIISSFEYQLLRDTFHVSEEQLFYMPLFADKLDEKKISDLPKYGERKDFYSIGNFLHEPNLDAVVQLKEKIWPLIRKELRDTKLHIYGAYTPERIKQFHNEKDGFLVHGRIESAKEAVEQARVCLAPLRFGAGQKGKLLESMICGTPSVTSSIGAESMHSSLPWPGFIEDEEESFARSAIALYKTESLWNDLQSRCYTIVNELFNKKDFEEHFLTAILEKVNSLPNSRNKNVLQKLLNHHSLKSSEYLSKWIMEKNKDV